MSLFKPRATLGQRKFLIKPRTQINIQQFSGKINPPQYKKTNKTQHTQAAVLHPDGTGRRVSFRTSSGCMDPTDAYAGRTEDSVDPARRNDRTSRGRSSRRRRQRPRRRSLTLRLTLQPLHRRQRRHDSTTGRRSRFRLVPRTDRPSLTTLRLSLQPLQTTASSRLQHWPSAPVPVRPGDRTALTPAVAYDGDLVVSRRTLAPVSSGEPTHSAFSWQQFCWNRSSQQLAPAAHTIRSYTSAHRVSQTQRSHLARTVEPNSTRLSHGCRTLLTRPFASTDSNQLSFLANFPRKPTKHVLFAPAHNCLIFRPSHV